jgi:hypothetical protein
MLNGNVFTIYIQRSEPVPKSKPLIANCQLQNTEVQNEQDHSKGGIFTNASFKNTCPPVSNRHCNNV